MAARNRMSFVDKILFLASIGAACAIVFGVALASLAGLDTAVREHFAGYRSHSSLLAGMAAVLVAIPFYVAGVPQDVIPPIALVAGLVAFFLLRRAFVRRSGGVGFRA